MGHSTATVTLLASELTSKLPSDIVADAVGYWYENEADRYDSARGGYPETKPLTGKGAAGSAYHSGDVHSEKSVIVPFTDEYTEKTATVRIEVTADELVQLRKGYLWELREEGRFGPHVINVEIAQLPKPRAPKAEATEGKAITKYRVTGANFGAKLKPSYPSQAEARAAAVAYMKENPSCAALSVEAFIVREGGGSALVRITREEPELATVSFKVTTQTPKKGARILGYLVAFDYHH